MPSSIRCAPCPTSGPATGSRGTCARASSSGASRRSRATNSPWRTTSHRVLARAAMRLMQHGWNPTWLLAYDEAWAVASELSAFVFETTGNRLNHDALLWHVGAHDAAPTAFSPHRDRQPEDARRTFREDGTAMYATAWVPLTDAGPENSCLCFVPAPNAPGTSTATTTARRRRMTKTTLSSTRTTLRTITELELSARESLARRIPCVWRYPTNRRSNASRASPPRRDRLSCSRTGSSTGARLRRRRRRRRTARRTSRASASASGSQTRRTSRRT